MSVFWRLRLAVAWNNTRWHLRSVTVVAAKRPVTTVATLLVLAGLVLGTGALYVHATTASASPAQALKPAAAMPHHTKPAVTKPVPAPVPATPEYVTVQSGQSLWSIAAQYLGSGSKWIKLWKLNRTEITDPAILEVGERVKL